jgi:isocitrate dehydrogenase
MPRISSRLPQQTDVLSISNHKTPIAYNSVLALQTKVSQAGFDVIKTENVYKFDGERQFSAGQGQG